MLRPVHDLDQAAHALTEGRYGEKAVVASGPPELRRLAASFNAMAEQITTLIERQRTFVSYASHQLRTPLGTLRLCIDNLGPSVRPSGITDYRLVAEEIERMGEICDALLHYARAEASAEEAEIVDARAVADSRVTAWLAVAAQAGVKLQRADTDEDLLVHATPQSLDQSLDALIGNTVKFAGKGAQVTVRTVPGPDGWIDIDVIDTGPGMPLEDLARATEAFYRRPTDQNVDGSGLGITIADALIAASGGNLSLMPANPHGVHARIRLPAATVPAPPEPVLEG
jgi:signal transduction histidine kinase